MANFCTKCGSPLDAGDKVCGQCGAPVVDIVSNAAPAQNVQAAQTPAGNVAATANAAQNKNKKKWIPVVIGAVIAIVVLVIAGNVIANHTGYKGTLNKMAKGIQKSDFDRLESLASFIEEDIYDGDIEDVYDERITNALDTFEDRVGRIKKVKYEIVDVTDLSDRRVEDIKDELIDNYNLDVSDIKKIKEVELDLTVKGSRKSSTYNVESLYLIKEQGGWKLLYSNYYF